MIRALLRLLVPVIASACVAITPAALAQPAGDHVVLPSPMPTASAAGTIDVVEVFWYGCPHCARLEGPLHKWIGRQPGDVRVRRLPAVLTESWRPAAQLHYALEALGRLDALHAAVFEDEHDKRTLQVQSRDVAVFANWAERRGIARQAFIEAWNSPAVAARVDEAARLTTPLKRIGVPAIVVDGRLLTTASLAGSQDGLFETADRLIAEVRKARPGTPPSKP